MHPIFVSALTIALATTLAADSVSTRSPAPTLMVTPDVVVIAPGSPDVDGSGEPLSILYTRCDTGHQCKQKPCGTKRPLGPAHVIGRDGPSRHAGETAATSPISQDSDDQE